MSRPDQYYSEVRAANQRIWDGIHDLVALQAEYNALDYGNNLPDGGNADPTKRTTNGDYTKAEVGAVVFATANAFVTLLGTGHATNMAKLL